MNRRTIIATIAFLSVGVFVVGAAFYNSNNSRPPQQLPAVENGAPLVRPHAPILGPAEAPVTIVEFIDPACEACRAFYPIVKQIMADNPDKVRLVLRYAAFHQTSEEAIRILEAARLQGKFEPVLVRLFETQPRWAPHGRAGDSAWSVLEGTGLDVEKAKVDQKMPDIVGVMNIDANDVKAAGVNQTPTFFVNGKPLPKFSAQQLIDLVKAEVASN